MGRLFAYVFGMGMAAAVVWPALADPPRDSYPLSTYPMFAYERGRPVIDQVVAVDGEGRTRAVPPELVANDEVMQAAMTVRNAVRQGPEAMRQLCRRVAERAALLPSFDDTVRIEIVSAQYDPIRYFTEGPEPLSRTHRFACNVSRPRRRR